MIDAICGTEWSTCHVTGAYAAFGLLGIFALAVIAVGIGNR